MGVIALPSARITPIRRDQFMRRLFTPAESGLSPDALKWGVRAGAWVRVVRGVYADGPEPPSNLDVERARVLAARTVARGGLACVLLGIDSIRLDGRPTRASLVEPSAVVGGIPCASALQALVDVAPLVDDDRWEQAFESALRKGLTSIAAFETELPRLRSERLPGSPRIRRVLARRPAGAPPTESLLETLAMQLARTVPRLGEPTRQHEIWWPDGTFVARVDLCWPRIGLFFELDGQHHDGQPVYDARRETGVVAATGWLPGRFTWHEIVRVPRATARRFDALALQAERRYTAPETPTAEPMA